MKRTTIILSLIFALAIALSVSIPTLAASDTDVVNITGTVPVILDITATLDNVAFGTFTIDTPAESTADTITVRCNRLGWTLIATETNGNTNDGKMELVSDPTQKLTQTLKVKGGDVGTYAGLETSPQLEQSGVRGVTSITNVQFAQTAVDTDEPGAYEIEVTFTASCAD